MDCRHISMLMTHCHLLSVAAQATHMSFMTQHCRVSPTLSSGCVQNKLKLNPSKKEFLWYTIHRRLLIDESPFIIGNATIQPAMSVWNLSFLMDRNLLLRSHITRLIGARFKALRQVWAIRRSLTTDASRMLVSSAVVSRIDYCNCIFAELPDFSLDRLQQVMNAAARVISRRRKYDHISDVLQDLHWLWVPQRIEFKLCFMVYKALHNLTPLYLSELCIPVTVVAARQRLRYSSTGNLVASKPRSEFGKRAFAFAGLHAWNNLPQMIKSSTSVAVFKSNWRHLFRQCYNFPVFFVYFDFQNFSVQLAYLII